MIGNISYYLRSLSLFVGGQSHYAAAAVRSLSPPTDFPPARLLVGICLASSV